MERVALLRTGNAMAMTPGHEDTAAGVTLIGSTESAMSGAWDIVKGEPLPAAVAAGQPTPLIVSTKLAELLGVGPGSPLRLRVSLGGGASALPPLDCRVAGIGTFQFEAEDFYTVATTMAGSRRLWGRDSEADADLVLVASAPGVGPEAASRAIRAARPDVRVYSNAQMVEQFNAHAFTYFRQISVVLSTMTLAFAFLLVATLLTMSVNQRLGEVAALRALGFPRRRIAANLLCESALLVGVGGAAALPLGGVLAIVLDRILRSLPGLAERLHFIVFEPRTVMLHRVPAAPLLAALYPVWLARSTADRGDAPPRDRVVTEASPIVEGRDLTRSSRCRPAR